MGDGTVGDAYAYRFTADQPVKWVLTGLPAGLAFDSSTGQVSGSPTEQGTFTLIVDATALSDPTNTSTTAVYLTIAPAIVLTPVITTAQLTNGTAGGTYSLQLSADIPVTWQATGLPEGLTLDPATGLITGTLTDAGSYEIFITATTPSGGVAGGVFDFLVEPAPAVTPKITSEPLPSGTVGDLYSFQVTASNSPFAFEASGLPDGLTMNHATGLITGTPTSPGRFDVVVDVLDSSKTVTDSQTSTVIIAPAPVASPKITSESLPGGTVGQSYSFQVTASNSPYAFEASGLPDGLTMSHTTGLITGTPTKSGTFTVNVSVLDSSKLATDSQTSTVVIAPEPLPMVTSGNPRPATVGQPYSFQLESSVPLVMYLVTGLPTGLTVNTGTGLISGTPTHATTTTITVVLDGGVRGTSDEVTYPFTVADSTPTPTPTPTVTPGSPTPTAPTTSTSSEGDSTSGSATSSNSVDATSAASSGSSSGSGSRGANGLSSYSDADPTALAETGQSAMALAAAGALALVLLIAGSLTLIARRTRRSATRR